MKLDDAAIARKHAHRRKVIAERHRKRREQAEKPRYVRIPELDDRLDARIDLKD